MPVYYRIDRESATVLYRSEGDVAEEDMIKISRAVVQDPEYEAGMNGIVDLRSVSPDLNISADGLRELSEFNRVLSVHHNRTRMAIVADTDLMYGFARMLQTYSDDLPSDYSVFRDMAEACDWLGISTAVWDASDGWIRVE